MMANSRVSLTKMISPFSSSVRFERSCDGKKVLKFANEILKI